MKNFRIYQLIIPLIFSILIGSVFASWTEITSSGDWTDKIMPDLTLEDDDYYEGIVSFTSDETPITNLTGYQNIWTVDINSSDIAFYDVFGREKRFYYVLELSSSNGETVYTNPVIVKCSSPFLSEKVRTVSFLNQEFRLLADASPVSNILIKKESDTLLTIAYQMSDELGFGYRGTGYRWQNETVSSDFWASVTIKLYAGHDGWGVFDAELTTDDYYNNDEVFELPFAPQPTEVNWFPDFLNPFNDLVNYLMGLFDTISSIAGSVFSMLGSLVQLLPVFFIAYLLDALIMSVSTMSIQPIGYFFRFLLSLGISLISTLADIIGSIIPF